MSFVWTTYWRSAANNTLRFSHTLTVWLPAPIQAKKSLLKMLWLCYLTAFWLHFSTHTEKSKRNKQGGENKHLPSVVSVFNTIGEKERAPQRPDILNIYSQNQTCAYGLISRRMSQKHTECVYRGEWCRLIEHGVVGYLRCMSGLNWFSHTKQQKQCVTGLCEQSSFSNN